MEVARTYHCDMFGRLLQQGCLVPPSMWACMYVHRWEGLCGGLNHGDKTVPARVHAAAQPYMFDSGLPGSPRKTPDEKLSPCM